MKAITIILTLILVAVGAADGAAQEKKHDSHGMYGEMANTTPKNEGNSGHEGMQMGGAMIMLETVTVEGVKAMAHLQNLSDAAGHAPAGVTHTFMAAFEEEGAMITKGRAAVKVTGPDGQTGKPINMRIKDGYFRSDVELKTPGLYSFEVGTKLADNKVRQFRFVYELKK